MLYTVKETAELSGVTVKALHHYHKIGLLFPREVNEAGYRLYGTEELERLQQILFYRELDFPLQDIKKALEDEPNRLECLIRQKCLLLGRRERLHYLLGTLSDSIHLARKGEAMDKSKMFQGLNGLLPPSCKQGGCFLVESLERNRQARNGFKSLRG